VEILDREFERIDALKANAEQNLQHAKVLFQAALRQELQPKEGWITLQIGNVCELKQGLAINAKTKYLLVEKSNLPLLRIKDLKDGTREIFVNESECPQGCRAYPEDIIYTRTGTLGLVFTGAYGVMHNNCFKIEIDKEKIDKYYLMYYLQQDSFRNNIIKLASRAAQPDITHKLFKEQIIHFPAIAEQVAITRKLSDFREYCQALEENYKKTIALCDDMKQALLRQAFNGEL
jgi:type I restriction enzyme S subunit